MVSHNSFVMTSGPYNVVHYLEKNYSNGQMQMLPFMVLLPLALAFPPFVVINEILFWKNPNKRVYMYRGVMQVHTQEIAVHICVQ